MHLFLTIAAGLVVLSVGLICMAIWSTEKDPEEEKDNVRQLYPDPNDPDYAIDRDNKPSWKPKQAQNN